MGGLLAVRLAQKRPERVRALVLMSVPLWLPTLTSAFVRLLGRLGHPWALPKLGGSDVRDREARRENPAYDQFPVRAVTELLALQAEVRSNLASVRQPTLIVHARRDHTASPACARALCSGLGGRDVRLCWLERSYHLVPIDVERDRVAQLVGDFVEEQLR